jgi:hypothetical protein
VALTQFLPLSHSACELLFAVWELQSKKGKGVTRRDIALRLGKTEVRVSGIIHTIRPVLENYLVETSHPRPGKEGERGHPLTHYHLNHAECVTIPETAFVLLASSDFPPEKAMRINREEFVNFLVNNQKIKEPEAVIQRRLDWCIEKMYLYSSDDRKFIWPHRRIDCERGYLELLARHAT